MIGELRKKVPTYLPAVNAIAEMSDRHSTILAARCDFLAKYIDDVCLEIYQEQNEVLLPTYTRIGVDGETNPQSDPFGKHGWRNRIGAADGDAIVLALKKFDHKSQSKKEMINRCERFWFHSGETPETVQRRLNTLKKELTSVLNHKYYQSLPKNEYKPLDGAEMATISATIKEIRTKGNGSVSAIKRATIDFELARLFPSPFGHVEFSFGKNRRGIVAGYSAPGPHQKNYCYADPITALNDLFKCVLDPSSVKSDEDMLQHLRSDEGARSGHLRGSDKDNLENHISAIESIRARNARLVKMSASIAKQMPKADQIKAYGAMSATTPQKQEAMTEVLVAALVTGMTNVVTYTIDDLETSISGLPGNENDVINIHGTGHNQSYSGVPAAQIREKMQILHLNQVKAIADKLKAQPEGDGTMFDNTMIMYFPEGGETHHGTGVEAPFIILSGKNCALDIAGRYIRLPYWLTKGHQTLGNWYTTLLNAHGNPIKHYGDLDAAMAREKLPQEGAIRHFIKKA